MWVLRVNFLFWFYHSMSYIWNVLELKEILRVGLSSAHVCLEHSANLGPDTATQMIGGTMF